MSLPPELDYAHVLAAMPKRLDRLLVQLNEKRYAAAKILAVDMVADFAIVLNFLREQEHNTPESK